MVIGMKKEYCFDASLPKKEVIALIHKKARPKKFFYLDGYMSFIEKENTIILQSLPSLIRHPQQRIFVAQLVGFDNWTMIKGHFKYPLIASLMWLPFAAFFIWKNIEAVSLSINLLEALYVTVLFSIFYFGVFLNFLMGKFLYRKHEQAVIDFISELTRTGGQDAT